jgi:hypothetical protein
VPLKKLFGLLFRAETRSKLFSVRALSVLLGKSSSTPLALGAMVKRGRTTWRWHEPCRTQQFALLFADRMLRNLGAPIHCFGQLMRANFLRSSLITTTASDQNFAPSRFDKPRGPVRYGGHPATEGRSCNRSHAQALAPLSKFEIPIPKKTKTA